MFKPFLCCFDIYGKQRHKKEMMPILVVKEIL